MNDIAPGPGNALPHIERVDRRVRGVIGNETIVDSSNARLVWEGRPYPQYYFPIDDVRMAAFEASDHRGSHELLGEASYFDLRVGGRAVERAAWRYSDSPVEELRGLIRIDWAAVDRWYEEDEEVFVHPKNPYTRVDVLDSSRHVRVEVDGVIVADTRRPKLLFETRLPTRYYIPREDVRMDLLTATDSGSRCPYKGVASYWSVEVEGTVHEDLVWSYAEPLPEVAKIAGLMCFYNEKADIIVDGARQERPTPRFS